MSTYDGLEEFNTKEELIEAIKNCPYHEINIFKGIPINFRKETTIVIEE
jgi:hypothetical protein